VSAEGRQEQLFAEVAWVESVGVDVAGDSAHSQPSRAGGC